MMPKVKLSGEEIVTLGRLKAGGRNVASYSDPAKNCAVYSRLWDLGYVDDLGTQQVLTDAGLKAYRKAYRTLISGTNREPEPDPAQVASREDE